MKKEISLVTGANGLLGNNIVRLLVENNIKVRATARNNNNKTPFVGLDCEVVYAELTNKKSLINAFKDVKNIYAVAANFKLWAKNPMEEIYDVNVQGTQNLFDAAKECGVKNIVYVSSVACLNYEKQPIKESNGYNTDRRNWYYNSKNDSDKLAIKLGKQYGIRTVLILPSAMIGGVAFKLNYTNQIVKQILDGNIPIDTNMSLNWIDVKDVARGALSAMRMGVNGERYVLANEKDMSIQESIRIASDLFPKLKLKIPPKAPKWLLYSIAGLMEFGSKMSGKEPQLQRHYIDMFYGLKHNFDISKSRKKLNFKPTPTKQALIGALKYLNNDWI